MTDDHDGNPQRVPKPSRDGTRPAELAGSPRDPPPPRLILIAGGARSGKSRFALARAQALGQRRLFIATAERSDDEMRERIARHRAERGDGFDTLEEPRALPEALAADRDHDVVLVDCLTIWISNLLVDGAAAGAVQERIAALLAALTRRRSHVVMVSNEVGMGLVPDTALGRAFRDLTGQAHQRLAAIADELYLAAIGVLLRLRPGPVEVVTA
jgi:adenosylcobinamide kinase/adenosylcobinamide-phosphate guanylyltransferase